MGVAIMTLLRAALDTLGGKETIAVRAFSHRAIELWDK